MLLIGDLLVEAGCFLLGVLLGSLILLLTLRRVRKGLKDPWELEEELDRLEEEERQAAQKQAELEIEKNREEQETIGSGSDDEEQ